MNKYLDLFYTFARVGICTFGGGYAMLPLFQRELVEKHGWVSEAEMADYYAISQCTPGTIGINVATIIGHKVAGVWGGILATLGMVFPSLVIIIVIAALLTNFAHLQVVQHAFAGIRVGVCVLVLNAILRLWKSAVIDIGSLIIYLLVLAAMLLFTVSPVLIVLSAGLLGVIIQSVRGRIKR